MADSTINQMPVTTQGMLDSVNSASWLSQSEGNLTRLDPEALQGRT